MKQILCDRCGKTANDGYSLELFKPLTGSSVRDVNHYDLCVECKEVIKKFIKPDDVAIGLGGMASQQFDHTRRVNK